MLKPYINHNTILSFMRYNHCISIQSSSPSKGKSPKSEFQGLILYLLSSNNYFIELAFNLSTLLQVKRYIGPFVNKLCLYSIGKS